jgi:hypothetical protein
MMYSVYEGFGLQAVKLPMVDYFLHPRTLVSPSDPCTLFPNVTKEEAGHIFVSISIGRHRFYETYCCHYRSTQCGKIDFF